MKYGVLKENHLFVKAYNKGKKVVTKHIVLFVLEDKKARYLQKRHPRKEKINRVGIAVTKKIRGAVKRNRTKRVIREAWRSLCKTHEILCGRLIVLAAREACADAKTPAVTKDLIYAAGKIGLLIKEKEAEKETC